MVMLRSSTKYFFGHFGQVIINVVWILESRGVVCATLGVERRDGTKLVKGGVGVRG
jgi:hypothetical protein